MTNEKIVNGIPIELGYGTVCGGKRVAPLTVIPTGHTGAVWVLKQTWDGEEYDTVILTAKDIIHLHRLAMARLNQIGGKFTQGVESHE